MQLLVRHVPVLPRKLNDRRLLRSPDKPGSPAFVPGTVGRSLRFRRDGVPQLRVLRGITRRLYRSPFNSILERGRKVLA